MSYLADEEKNEEHKRNTLQLVQDDIALLKTDLGTKSLAQLVQDGINQQLYPGTW